ncbi:SagB/ThcOx family dehydrogenase [Amycolatopsis anabasis]|uniref:SagB/ThcOx family dehydrogenase n=1 Tax=Amycolatopsis anabasis TaxID=1840409 RepID=UPI00131DD62A|nr:SagB/ThcOx family dehydrogenase [Amycolatopsis anabasis]
MSAPFEAFWTAGRTTPVTQRRLADQMRDHRPEQPSLDPFELPGQYHELRRSSDRLDRVFRRRCSDREFRPVPLPGKQLGSVLAALAEDEGRSYPSAGGLYPLRCYPMLLNVWHELNGRVCRYAPGRHALQEVGPCPRWPELAPLLGAAEEGPGPQFALAFVLADEPLLAKYGPRGGRFGLIEVGAALQSVALRMAAEHLGGYLLGGAADAAMLELLGLTGMPVRLGAVLAGGLPAGGR